MITPIRTKEHSWTQAKQKINKKSLVSWQPGQEGKYNRCHTSFCLINEYFQTLGTLEISSHLWTLQGEFLHGSLCIGSRKMEYSTFSVIILTNKQEEICVQFFPLTPDMKTIKQDVVFIKSMLQKECVRVLSTLMNPLCDFVLTQCCFPLPAFVRFLWFCFSRGDISIICYRPLFPAPFWQPEQNE